MPGRCRMGMRQLRQHTTKLKYDIVELVTDYCIFSGGATATSCFNSEDSSAAKTVAIM
jgi:hypothetical protein